ncbi:MAG: TatD family hydrolase [Opitutales bacterium]|nr:TatD family hydrolase [Opitutales bacterium]
MNFYDAHSHLHFPENSEALKEFARAKNVWACSASASLKDMPCLAETASKLGEFIKAAYGIHPWFASEYKIFPEAELAKFLPYARAVGEIGLDKNRPGYDLQIEFFRRQLEIASDCGLPAVVHCCGAWGDLVKILESVRPARRFMIHAANCSAELAGELSKLGAFFSFGARELASAKGAACAKAAEPSKILVESDGGAKAGDLLLAAAILARVRGEGEGRILEAVGENFSEFFKK